MPKSKIFTCTQCQHHVPEAKFAFSSRPYTPINAPAFSIVEIKCPDCNHAQCSAFVPAGTPFEALPKIMKAALAEDHKKLQHYLFKETSVSS